MPINTNILKKNMRINRDSDVCFIEKMNFVLIKNVFL